MLCLASFIAMLLLCCSATAQVHSIYPRAGEDNHGFSPAWSPDGRQLAFAIIENRFAYEDRDRDIWVIGVDDGDMRRLTTDPADDTDPTWSPDGTHIAFASERTGQWDIHIVNVSDLAVNRITDDPRSDAEPSWSPGAERIAYVSGGDLYTMDANGGNRIRITEHEAMNSEPAWSPDGTKIAFSSRRSGNGDIYTFDLAQAELIRVTDCKSYEDDPSWSPDGSKIVFTRSIGTDKRFEALHVINLDDGIVRYLNIYGTFHGHHNPHWSPDGSWIAYQFGVELAIVSATDALSVVEDLSWGLLKRVLIGDRRR